jgi:hypothetical protein
MSYLFKNTIQLGESFSAGTMVIKTGAYTKVHVFVSK